MILETIAFNLESASIAEANGADRIELCAGHSDGGTTPSYGSIMLIKNHTSLPVNVMIRPRGGDFLYSEPEFEAMKQDVMVCKQAKVNGIVFGILRADGTVDEERCKELLRLAHPLEATFHRAFDRASNAFAALEKIIECGFTTILSSGQKNTATEGIELLELLVKQAKNKITIMPGSGITEKNIHELILKTKASAYHISGGSFVDSAMKYQHTQIKDANHQDEKNMIFTADGEKIRKMKALISSFKN